MAKYETRPTVVDAIEWDGNANTANEFLGEQYGVDWFYISARESKDMKTSSSTIIIGHIKYPDDDVCGVGDYIVRDGHGKYSVHKKDHFEMRYKPLNDKLLRDH